MAAENGAMAERVAWRIVRDWLEAQVAMIEVGMMALDEVMLPHLLVDEHRTAPRPGRGERLARKVWNDRGRGV